MVGRGGGFIDHGACQPGEFHVRLSFFIQSLLQHAGRFFKPEPGRQSARRAIAGNLIMLDALRSADEAGIPHIWAGLFSDQLRAFFHKTLHGLACVPAKACAHALGNFFQTVHMAARLVQVDLQISAQLGVGGRPGHARQRGDDLFFSAVKVAELMLQQVFEGVEFHERRIAGRKQPGWITRLPALKRVQAAPLRRAGAAAGDAFHKGNAPLTLSFMNTKDELIEWLRDAYAMEKAMEIALKKQMDSDETLQPLRDLFEIHHAETQNHAQAVEGCLKSLDSNTSAVKTTFAEAIETMKSVGASFTRDAGVKAMLASYAAEHFEIGCYLALIAGARNLGLPDIAQTCEKILADEKRMADWLEANVTHAVTSYLKEASTESQSRAAGAPAPRRHVEDIDTPVEAGADDDPADAFRSEESRAVAAPPAQRRQVNVPVVLR